MGDRLGTPCNADFFPPPFSVFLYQLILHWIIGTFFFDTFIFSEEFKGQGIARTQSPLRKNYALESPTFVVIAEVNLTEVQWKGLTLDRLP